LASPRRPRRMGGGPRAVGARPCAHSRRGPGRRGDGGWGRGGRGRGWGGDGRGGGRRESGGPRGGRPGSGGGESPVGRRRDVVVLIRLDPVDRGMPRRGRL